MYLIAVVAAINILGGYGLVFAPRVGNAAQTAALHMIHAKIDRMCDRLAATARPGTDATVVLQKLIGDPTGPGGRAIPLVPSACDVLDCSGLVDP